MERESKVSQGGLDKVGHLTELSRGKKMHLPGMCVLMAELCVVGMKMQAERNKIQEGLLSE